MPDPSWNQTDQDCNAFDLNWSAHVNGSATLITTTYDGRSVYKYDCPQPGSSNNAYAVNTSLSAWTECTAEVVFRMDGTDGNHIVLQFYLRDSTPHEYNANLYFDTQWTAHPYIWMAAPLLGVDLQQWIDIDENGWHTLRVVINSSRKMWVWVDGIYLGSITHDGTVASGYTVNTIGVHAYGPQRTPPPSNRVLYVDHIRMSTSKVEPDYHGLVNVQGYPINTRMASLGPGNMGGLTDVNPADALRYMRTGRPRGDVKYGLPLVSTGDDLASKVRVYLGGSVKAFQKMPVSF